MIATTARAISNRVRHVQAARPPVRLALAGIALLVLAGIALRLSTALHSTLAVDEAESSINALTIFHHGYPSSEYLSLPIYENTLTIPWEDSEEYEFRDSSYSRKGIAVYHAWLPLYAIAAAEALAGIRPDEVQPVPRVQHTADSVLLRTLAPRVPAIFFSAAFILIVARLAWEIAGAPAALATATWAALSERLVFLGHQARYYSLTLCMTAAVALALWRAARRGRWQDYVLLGVTEGLLFHTHQLSSIVMALVSLMAVPAIVRQDRWLAKSASALGLAGAITIPWAIASGFFEAAASVPKVHALFTSWKDWIAYPADRPASLALLVLALAASIWASHAPRFLPPAFRAHIQALLPNAACLTGWLLIAYGTMHLLVPAASYFTQRLTLMLQVPGILLVSLAIGAVAQALAPRRASLVATGLAFAALVGTGKLAAFEGFRPRFTEAPVLSALSNRTFAPGTRFYATPNLHLAYTYYTGLPIQSIAPVRRSFLDAYEGPIVFIEHRHMAAFPRANEILRAAERAGESLTPEQVNNFRGTIWSHQVLADLRRRGLPAPDPAPLPPYLEGVLDDTRTRWRNIEAAYVRDQRGRPIFREVQVEQAGDLWMSFFYRFVDYPARIGRHANIQGRLQNAEVEPRPESSAVIFYSRSPHTPAPQRALAEPAPASP